MLEQAMVALEGHHVARITDDHGSLMRVRDLLEEGEHPSVLNMAITRRSFNSTRSTCILHKGAILKEATTLVFRLIHLYKLRTPMEPAEVIPAETWSRQSALPCPHPLCSPLLLIGTNHLP
jgi:hypothetical protein